MPNITQVAEQAASFRSSDYYLRACVLRLRLCIHLLDGEHLPQNIVPSLNLLLSHALSTDTPGKGRLDGMAEMILASLQAQKQLCEIVTTSMANLEDNFCGRGRAIQYRRRVLDLLIVSIALTSELVTVYLESPDDELRSINLQAIQAKLKQVAGSLVNVRKYRKNSAKAAHRRARGGTSNPIEIFTARARTDYLRMEPQVSADSVVAAEMRLVSLARNTISVSDWPKGMQVDMTLDSLMTSLLADLWTVERLDSRATSSVASEVIALMASASSPPTTESTCRIVNDDAKSLCDKLSIQLKSHDPSSSMAQQCELLLGYVYLIRDVMRYNMSKTPVGPRNPVPEGNEEGWIAELKHGATTVDMT